VTSAPQNPICVALDSPRRADLDRIADAVEDHVGLFKIGLTAFNANGGELVGSLSRRLPVFLDLKLHDIPAQVEGAAAVVAGLGASYLTVHSSGGSDMVKAAVSAAGTVTVLGVTILTSLDDTDLERIGIRGPTGNAVLRLADVALSAGAPGLVCSPQEVARLRREFGTDPLLVVPGIRRDDVPPDDQRRTLTARAALDAGADILVIGRPITGAPDPAAAAEAFAAEVGG